MTLGWDSHVQMNEMEFLPQNIWKLTQIESNVKAKIIKLLWDNIWVNLCDFVFHNYFLGVMPKAQETKEKIDNLYFIKMQSFSVS